MNFVKYPDVQTKCRSEIFEVREVFFLFYVKLKRYTKFGVPDAHFDKYWLLRHAQDENDGNPK
jgi:hypothetical protein